MMKNMRNWYVCAKYDIQIYEISISISKCNPCNYVHMCNYVFVFTEDSWHFHTFLGHHVLYLEDLIFVSALQFVFLNTQ